MSRISGCNSVKRNVSSWVQKVAGDGADVTFGGRKQCLHRKLTYQFANIATVSGQASTIAVVFNQGSAEPNGFVSASQASKNTKISAEVVDKHCANG